MSACLPGDADHRSSKALEIQVEQRSGFGAMNEFGEHEPLREELVEATCRRYCTAGKFDREFVRGKLRHDPMYWPVLGSPNLPSSGRLIDIGCGRGILLALLDSARRLEGGSSASWRPPSDRLELVGVELRPSLATVARRALGDAAWIEARNAADGDLPSARMIVLLDVLHYLSSTQQSELLRRVAAALEPGGTLVMREADAALGRRFVATRIAERVCAIARGHWRQGFTYRSAAAWRQLLEQHGLVVTERPMWTGTPYANRLVEASKPSS